LAQLFVAATTVPRSPLPLILLRHGARCTGNATFTGLVRLYRSLAFSRLSDDLPLATRPAGALHPRRLGRAAECRRQCDRGRPCPGVAPAVGALAARALAGERALCRAPRWPNGQFRGWPHQS